MSAAALSLLLAVVTQGEVPAVDAPEASAETQPAIQATLQEVRAELGIEEGQTPEPREYHEINDDMRAALRAEALAETPEERAVQIRKLCALHVELVTDPRYSESDYLKRLRGLIYSRLIRVKDDLERDIARQPAAPAETPAETPASPGETEPVAEELIGAPGGAAADDGEALVELIQTVISPDNWDVNGGNGSIVYWANGHALVVRASGEVHHRMGGLLEGLRQAGN